MEEHMSEHTIVPDPSPLGAEPEITHTDTKKKTKGNKKKDRIRAAWISFASRILAQFIGAAASVVLGLLVVRHYTTAVDSKAIRTASSRSLAARPGPPTRISASPGTIALAVLPLKDFSPGRPPQALADALTEALVTDLARIDGLRVTSRTSSMRYKDTNKSLREIAEELGVDVVVEGSVVQADGIVRITAQLIEASTDEHLWAQSFDRPVGDALGLEAEVATAIARRVGFTLAPPPARPMPASLTADQGLR